jgi:hypothetical protein
MITAIDSLRNTNFEETLINHVQKSEFLYNYLTPIQEHISNIMVDDFPDYTITPLIIKNKRNK